MSDGEVEVEVEVERVPQMVGGSTERPAERIEYTRPSLIRGVVIVGGVGMATVVVVAASTVVWWLLIAAVVGAALYPVSAMLGRRMPTAVALLLVTVGVLFVAGGLGFRGLSEVKEQTESVRANVVESARQVEASPDYGPTAQRIGLTDKVTGAFESVPGSSNQVAAPIQLVSTSGGALFSIAMLSLLFVIFWPELYRGALRQAGNNVRRERLAMHVRRSYWACARFVGLTAGRAVVVGLVAWLVASMLGAGAPTLVGLWFAIASVVPAVGLVVAMIPLALIVTIRSPGQALALLVVAIVVQALDATLVQKRIDEHSVRLGPAIALLAMLLGFQLYGVGGIIVALGTAAFALAFVASLTDQRRDLAEAARTLVDNTDDAATRSQRTAAVTDRGDGGVTWWYELGWRTPLTVALAAVGLVAVVSMTVSGPVVSLAATAILLSFGFDPLITRLQGWTRMSRGLAVGTFFCVVSALFLVSVVAFLPSTVQQAGAVQQDLPRAVDDLTELPIVGPALAEQHAPDRIREWAEGVPAQVANDPAGIGAVATTGGVAFLAALVVVLLLIAFLIDGPWLVDLVVMVIPQRRLDVVSHAGGLVAKTAGRYFSGSLVLAGLQAVQVLITGLLLGVPLTPVLALWAGIWTLVPQIGGAIGGLPFVLLAFSHGATAGLIATGAFGLYLVIANNVLLPVIVGKAVDVSPLATMVATIAGFTLLGIIGAVLAVPMFGATKSIYKALRPLTSDDDGDDDRDRDHGDDERSGAPPRPSVFRRRPTSSPSPSVLVPEPA